MIRYVVAVILTVAIVSVGMAGLDGVAQTNSERQVDADVADLEDAAVSLVQNEELPPEGHEGSRRVVTFDLPDDTLTTDRVEFVEIYLHDSYNFTTITYRVEGGANQTQTIDTPIARADKNTRSVEFTGSGPIEIELTLAETDEGIRIAHITRIGSAEYA